MPCQYSDAEARTHILIEEYTVSTLYWNLNVTQSPLHSALPFGRAPVCASEHRCHTWNRGVALLAVSPVCFGHF